MSQSSSHIVLACVLKVMRPLARLLLKNGVTYPALAQALKPVFLKGEDMTKFLEQDDALNKSLMTEAGFVAK